MAGLVIELKNRGGTSLCSTVCGRVCGTSLLTVTRVQRFETHLLNEELWLTSVPGELV